MNLVNGAINTTNYKAREEIVKLLACNAIAVELGVAEGKFSKKLLDNHSFSILYGIDIYAGDRGHDDAQYNSAKKLTEEYEDYKLIRKKFEEALQDFPDEYFDFIYIDGYAHTGNESGKTMQDWYPKLKSGGIFSGDDYTERYRENFDAVNNFAKQYELELSVINDWNSHRTWLCKKP